MIEATINDIQSWENKSELLNNNPDSIFQLQYEINSKKSSANPVSNSDQLLVLFTTFSASEEKYTCSKAQYHGFLWHQK